eukprot:TRINITY_DN2677_c0_g1_i2.p1 TRINITY_DN2677_c0_g1~~TRINITY_DN2677_c0_g1_i2.p1  ORF type:complete len:299 (-),score=71.48 TRINITY_DN2677_c0_g1_i2:29-925(-)
MPSRFVWKCRSELINCSLWFAGYWAEPVVTDWTPDEALQTFLAAGDPPVYIGFGSMPLFDTKLFVRDCVTAVQANGKRAIICAGWSGLDQSDVPADVLFIKAAPHTWLFPRCCAAIHHGGAGTTFASMRSGIPTIIFPVVGDQPFWAHRMAALGTGPSKVVTVKEMNATTLTSQLKDALRPEVTVNARALAAKLAAEDGVAAGIMLVDTLWEHDKEYKRTMNEALGPVSWKATAGVTNCDSCKSAFGFFNKAHNCSTCGNVFCKSCCKARPLLNWNGTPLVCNRCSGIVDTCWKPHAT